VADDVVIAPFEAAQQDAVRALVLAGLAERWGTIDQSLNADLDDLAARYAHGCVLVASRTGQVVGAGALVPVDDDTAEMVRVSVASSERGRGVGRALVEALVDVAASWHVRRVVCETTSTWTSAVALYVRCGFTITGTRASEFGPETLFARELDVALPEG
jgi:ribosomal protein S18 acetylase RimI-like enzyme